MFNISDIRVMVVIHRYIVATRIILRSLNALVTHPLVPCHKPAQNQPLLPPHVVRAQLFRLSTVDAHTDVLKPIHGKII